jgi:hypothetical protein
VEKDIYFVPGKITPQGFASHPHLIALKSPKCNHLFLLSLNFYLLSDFKED